jgi:hypothetical protein
MESDYSFSSTLVSRANRSGLPVRTTPFPDLFGTHANRQALFFCPTGHGNQPSRLPPLKTKHFLAAFGNIIMG